MRIKLSHSDDHGCSSVELLFARSPTILIDGVDAFAMPGAPAGVMCRLYPSAAGASDAPKVGAVRDTLITRGLPEPP